MNIKYIVGGVIILGFAIYAVFSFKSSLTPYVSIKEAKSNGGVVQVKGQRLNSGQYDIENNVFTFRLEDQDGNDMDVIFDGAKPGNFDQATEIVCIGEYREGKFHAKDILVKCPSKYQEMGTEHPDNIKT